MLKTLKLPNSNSNIAYNQSSKAFSFVLVGIILLEVGSNFDYLIFLD